MPKATRVDFHFVEEMPTELDDATVYISIPYRMTAHMCLCGCGEKVVNPLRPNRWSLSYDGATISLDPSVGNSGIACKTHYWIRRNGVRWLPPMTERQSADAFELDGWHDEVAEEVPAVRSGGQPRRGGWIRRLLRRACWWR